MRKFTQTFLVVLLAMFTTSAYADNVAKIGSTEYATLAAAVDAVPSDGTPTTITLLGNAQGSGVKVVAGKNITFDLAGYTYEVTTPTVGSPGTETNGFQLLRNSTVTFKNGTVTSNSALILIQNYSKLTLDNVKVGNASSTKQQYAVSNNFGEMNATGATDIIASTVCSPNVAFDAWYGMSSNYDAGIKITFDENFTGNVTGKVEYGAANRAKSTEGWQDKATVEIKAGNFDVEFVESNGGEITDANITISGGTFEETFPEEFLADDMALVATDEGYAVKTETDAEAASVAKIGNTYYATLHDAVQNVQAGENITLVNDATVNAIETVDKQFTIDLNGKSVINNVTGGRWMTLNAGADITIDGTTDGSALVIPATNTNSYGFFRVDGEESQLTINGATMTGNTDNGAFVRAGDNAYATINLNNVTAETNYRFVACGSWTWTELNVTGGTYTHNNKDVRSGGGVVPAFYLAGFESVFDGVTITSEIGSCVEVAGYKPYTKGTFRNNNFSVTQTSADQSWNNVAIAVDNNGEVVVESGTYNGGQGYGLYVFTSGGAVDIQGGTFSGAKASVRSDFDSSSYGQYGWTSDVKIENGTFEGPLKTNGNASATIEVSAGSFDQAVPEQFCAEGYEPTPAGPDGRYTVAPENSVLLYDTEATIAAVDNKTVCFANRTLYSNMWNTLCLPFGIANIEGTVLEGADIRPFTGGELNDETNYLDLKFGSSVTAIEAGVPYAIKPAGDVANPSFKNVSFDANPTAGQTSTGTVAEFVGTFGPTDIPGGKEYLFITKGNGLVYVTDAFTYNGFRGYFKVNEETAAAANGFNMSFDEDVTAISTVETKAETTKAEGWYTINGVKLNAAPTAKGLYILNGKKVVVK